MELMKIYIVDEWNALKIGHDDISSVYIKIITARFVTLVTSQK